MDSCSNNNETGEEKIIGGIDADAVVTAAHAALDK
jgi:hypothetical protein